MADVGKAHDLQRDLGIQDKRVPQWLVPNGNTTRPDILLVHKNINQVPTQGPLPPGTKVTVVEVTYRPDHDTDAAQERKQSQHQETIGRLTQHGYDVEYQIWDIGHTGVIPDRLTEYTQRLGIDDPDKLMLDLHFNSVSHLSKTVQCRRIEERKA
jgi:hypothetical protein